MTTKPEVLSIRVSGDLSAALKALADAQGVSVSDILRRAAEDVVHGRACTGLCSRPAATETAPVVACTWFCGCGTPITPTLTLAS